MIRANASKVHAVVIVDILCVTSSKIYILPRYDAAGEDVNLKCPSSFSRPVMGKFAYLHELSSIDTLERDFGLLVLRGDIVHIITLYKEYFY